MIKVLLAPFLLFSSLLAPFLAPTATAESLPASVAPGITLDQAAERLIREIEAARANGAPEPRIAVVFSGGGAKCSYQVGAIQAVEEKLADIRKKLSDPSIDIDLVVGTSGGALNALPVALGISALPDSLGDFSQVWEELDQRDLIRPSKIIRALMILWFVCIQGIILLRLRRRRHFKKPEKYPWIISRVVITIGLLQVAVARMPIKPWSLLGTNSAVHHFWLWLSWGLEGSGWTLTAIGIIAWALRKVERVKLVGFLPKYRVLRTIFWFGALAIPPLQTFNILFIQSTLSDNSGIERAVVKNFVTLINSHLSHLGQQPLQVKPTDFSKDSLRSIGEELVARKLLKRDLVLTGSALPTVSSEIAGDIYFYARHSGDSPPPKFSARTVSLDQRPELFMDALIGSGAIYPIFPARIVEGLNGGDDITEVVDGSFEHRSPVQAAAEWGATHVLLIQAATDEVVRRGSFADNINAALNHLYDQAQLLDLRTKRLIETITLIPRPPHIGLLDFSDNLIRTSIDKGYREASDPESPNWRWQSADLHYQERSKSESSSEAAKKD